MSQNFIQIEAQKHQTLTDEIIDEMSPKIQDANSVGNLLGATVGTIAGLMNLTVGSKLLVALSTGKGAILNYGISVAEETYTKCCVQQ